MNTITPFIIMSAERPEFSDVENAGRVDAMSKWLDGKGFAHKPVIGCYKGAQEVSFVIPLGQANDWELRRLARAYGQESILHVDANRQAHIEYVSKHAPSEHLGTFRRVDSVDGLDAYTHDIVEDVYYVAG